MRGHALAPDAFPAIVAHRGASSTHPENTLASFEQAVRLGARLVEFDVRLSRDGVPVVMHDPTVDRTTDGHGRVDELTATEIASLNAGTPAAPEPVPRLDEVLALLSGRAGAVLEIKNLPWEPGYRSDALPLIEVVLFALERSAFVGSVLVVSFDPATLAASKQAARELPAGVLSAPPIAPRDALAFAVAYDLEVVLPGTRSLLPVGRAFVEEVHETGRRLGTWTVDEAWTLRGLLDDGVDAVASNDPAMALAVLADRAAR